jgi:two-component sensor histidine kinase
MLALMSVILVAEQYGAERGKAAVEAHRAAHVVATQFGWIFDSGARALGRIEERLYPVGGAPPAPDAGAQEGGSLAQAVRDAPPGMHFSVYDAAGRMTYSSLPDAPAISVADRPYFAALRAGRETVVSPMLTERQSGEQVFILGRRLDDGARFAGIATFAIPVRRLVELSAAIGFEGSSSVSLVGMDGMLIARSPPIAPMDLSGSTLFEKLREAPDGHYETISPADGVRRVVGFWTLENWPVVAITGLDWNAAMQGFWRSIATAFLLAVPLLFGMGWLIHDLVRLMRLDERRQRELTLASDRSNYLLREIHHRVKNNLQTVISLIRLEQLPAEVKARLLGRIGAMVSVHEAMYRTDQFEEICIRPYLEQLVADVAKGFGAPVEVRFDIAEVRIAGARAMLLGLLANELVSNAFKHAFAPRGGGRLDVSVTVQEGGMLRLCVADDGPGYGADAGSQMGSRLIEAFAEQLGGTVRIESAGRTVAVFDFPRDYGPVDDPPAPPRAAQFGSVAGARSRKAIRPSR